MISTSKRKPSGYWQNFANVKREIDAFILAHGTPGMMPKENVLKQMEYGSLAHTIHSHGGFQKVASRLGLATSRNPNGLFDDVEVLTTAVKSWAENFGQPGMMPTSEELKRSGRNDLVIAITKHGGPQALAPQCGLAMTYEKRPDGYYNEFGLVADEIYAFVDAQNLKSMPTPRQLRSSDHGALVHPLIAHGGFWEVARRLGLAPNRRSPGYWTYESIDAAVKEFIQSTKTEGFMPSDFELREAGRCDLSVAISRHGGGMAATAIRLGLDPGQRKADGFWEGENVIETELLQFISEYGTPGMMPTQEHLSRSGRNNLAIAITRFGNGWEAISSRLNLQMAQAPKGHWKNFENVRAEILAFNARRGRPGEMPMKNDLDYEGLSGLSGAISDFGGYPGVAKRLGLVAGRISLWPRSRDELIIAHELMLFFDIDLNDRKITSAVRTHDADIVVRSLNLIIEYDCHYYHQENDTIDLAKTEALQRAGWLVIRLREHPLEPLQPTDIVVRKGRFKKTCNLVLERLQSMRTSTIPGLAEYIDQPELKNKTECSRYIHQVLDDRLGTNSESLPGTPDAA